MRIKTGHWLFDKPFAHRGLHSEPNIPENTIAAFSAAIDKGYGIELDVQLSQDGEVVVFHDATLEHLSNGSGRVKDATFAALQELRVLNTDHAIPSLNQVLQLVRGQIPLLVEVKGLRGGSSSLDEAVALELDLYKGDYAVVAFNPYRLAWFVKNRPEVLRGQITERYFKYQLPWWKKVAYSQCLLNFMSKPDFISCEINMLSSWRMQGLKRRGLPIISWTINTPARLKAARRYVDNIIFERLDPTPLDYRDKLIP